MKFQRKMVSNGSRALAILGSIVRAIELDADELDVDGIVLSFRNYPLHSTTALLEEDTIEVFISGAPWLEERELEIEDVGVIVYIKPSSISGYGLRLRSLYEILPRTVISLDLDFLRKLSHITTVSGVEFIALYRGEGSLLLLEGDRYKVTIPGIEVLATIHTHPEGACELSNADVRSAAYTLADLALFEAIVTPTCAFYIARIGFLDEYEFEKLLNNESGIADPLELTTVKAERLRLPI